jgi:hypothetical protein
VLLGVDGQRRVVGHEVGRTDRPPEVGDVEHHASGRRVVVERQPLDANRLARKLRRTGSLTLSELAYLRESDDASLDRLLDEYATAVDAEADADGREQATMNRF